MVAALMAHSRSASASVRSSSPSRRRSGTSTESIGASRLPAGRRATRQHELQGRDDPGRVTGVRGAAPGRTGRISPMARSWARA